MASEKKEQGVAANSAASAAARKGPIICPGHSRPVPGVAYSGETVDGVFMISACLDGKAMMRDGETGDWIGTFEGHKGAVWSAALDKHAVRCVTAAADSTAKCWDATTGALLHSFEHKHVVKVASFMGGDRKLMTGGFEKKLRVFDLSKPDAAPQQFEAGVKIDSLVDLPAPGLVALAGPEKAVQLWDLRSGKVAKRLDTDGPLLHLSCTLDGSTLIGTYDKTVRFWDAKSLKTLHTHTLPREITSAALDPAGKRFVAGSSEELWLRAYEVDSGKEIACNKGHHGPVRCCAVHPSGKTYASGSEDGTIRIWQWAA